MCPLPRDWAIALLPLQRGLRFKDGKQLPRETSEQHAINLGHIFGVAFRAPPLPRWTTKAGDLVNEAVYNYADIHDRVH